MEGQQKEVFRIENIPGVREGAGEPEFMITRKNEWRYERNRSLNHRRTGYCVDLDECNSSAEVLDWIFQIFKKTWCTEKTIRDLLLQMEKHLNPQANLCSFGIERGPFRVARRVRQAHLQGKDAHGA
jgi:hypothetical protein